MCTLVHIHTICLHYFFKFENKYWFFVYEFKTIMLFAILEAFTYHTCLLFLCLWTCAHKNTRKFIQTNSKHSCANSSLYVFLEKYRILLFVCLLKTFYQKIITRPFIRRYAKNWKKNAYLDVKVSANWWAACYVWQSYRYLKATF